MKISLHYYSSEIKTKKVKVETEIINKVSPNIPTSNITELNELIYTGKKSCSVKIGVPQWNPIRNTKLS